MPVLVYHGEVNQDSDGPVEVCVPVTFGEEASTDAGSPREVYFTDFGSAAPTDEVCDVAFPVLSA